MNGQNAETGMFIGADIEKALQKIWENREKEKKIKQMNSTQRKRHQRQFAVMHFFLNKMEQFMGEISRDSAQKKMVTVVSDKQSSQAAELLGRQIEKMKDSGFAIAVQRYSSNAFQKSWRNDLNAKENYVIYIGDFSESKKISDGIWYRHFHNFGFRYGWIGQEAAITFDRKPSTEEFAQMVNIAETEFAKAEHEIDMLSKLEGNFWDELSTAQKVLMGTGIAALALVGAGGVAAAVTGNKDKRQKEPDPEYPDGRPDPAYLPEEMVNMDVSADIGCVQDILDDVNEMLDDLQPGEEGGRFYDLGDYGICYGPL